MSSPKLLAKVVGAAVSIFYRCRILPAGARLPASGPILVVANHPNALIDPMLIQNLLTKTSGRRMRPVAKAPLFKMPVLSLLVKSLEAIPVYRSKDGADTRQNADSFRAIDEALLNGAAVLIFPEGVSHDQPALQPLKTGAARMALSAYAKGAEGLLVIPVGLTFADKLAFRSTAAVELGTPLKVADYLPASDSEEDARAAVQRLTAAIWEQLQQLTVNLESWEDLPILETVDAIWRLNDPERLRRLKVLADGTTNLRKQNRDYVDDLRARLSEWRLRLERLGLRPHDLAEGAVQARRNPFKMFVFSARSLVSLVLGLPIALLGAVFWNAPYWATHLVWRLWRPERDVGATVKVLAGLVLYPIWYFLALLGLARWLPLSLVLILAVLTPPAGMLALHYFRHQFYAVDQLATFIQFSWQGKLQESLLRERDAFCREIDQLVQRLEGPERDDTEQNREQGAGQ